MSKQTDEILSIFDYATASPATADSPSCPSSLVARVICMHDPERFDNWPYASLRMMLAAFLAFAPADEIEPALGDARAWLRWFKRFEVRCEIEHNIEGPMHMALPWGEREARRIARAEARS